MITLKKSFELQNYYKNLFESALSILFDHNNVTVTTQTHMRKKAYAEAEDETIIKPKSVEHSFTPNELIKFAEYLQGEMEKLTAEINVAKKSSKNDFDGMIATNNQKRRLLSRMVSLAGIKSREHMVEGLGKKFNDEGNQVNYFYDVKEVTTIDFDRNMVRSIIGRLRKELDDASTELDKMQLEVVVFYIPVFEIGDTLEEAVDKWRTIT